VIRQLTSGEKKYYQALIGAMSAKDPKQALSNLETTMPETVILSVFEDLKAEHPLLGEINFVNAKYLTKWLLNKNGKQKAIWGTVTAEFTEELVGDFEEYDITLNSLTAYMPVSKAMIDLGDAWLDKYIREILKDAIAVGLESGIINGTGVNQPIGMTKDLEAARADGEPYVEKTPIAVTQLTPTVYGNIISNIAKSRNNRQRKVTEVIMIVNPVDYFNKVLPATTLMMPSGEYKNNIFPYPTKLIQSEEVEAGKAIVGLANKYFAGIGTSKEGAIGYDDSVRFIQRQRVYGIFLYGNGKPLDNNAFQVLDISGLEPLVYQVGGTVNTIDITPAG
jgi:hypothetical protein